MNKRNVRTLFVAVLALVGILVVLETNQRDDTMANVQLLFPQMKNQVNEIEKISLSRSGDTRATEISKESGTWTVPARQNYPADVGKIRQLLLAFTDARVIEQKTSNPDRYAQLGVQDLENPGSTGVRVAATGPDIEYDIIVGNTAQGEFRYVRIANAPESWLIDQSPTIPESVGEWLQPGIIDIDTARIQTVTVSHKDGETIRISKETAEDQDFAIEAIPDGRELSYASVANSIANGLKSLTLDDVRAAPELSTATDDATTSSEYATFDGLQLLVLSNRSDEETWISIQASANDDSAESVTDEVAAINELVSTWQFKIAETKADGLTKRWEDLLQAEE